ncbi:MAG: ATP-dependent helicase [Candidatus Limnocylindrales bacterium]
MHPTVEARLTRLSADQRTAATAPPGPVLCVAPAGSGKTTTLVARVAWRIDEGARPETMAALTFNRRAADELRGRLHEALVPLIRETEAVRVRTFHALGLEILGDAGLPVAPLVDRLEIIASLAGHTLPASALRRLDDGFSRIKLDAGLDLDGARRELAASRTTESRPAADPQATTILEAFVAYEAELERLGALDFDDLVARALRALEGDAALLTRWRRRCHILFVDETQDLDRSQLRLACLLAADANDLFLVGDDDQTIYAWRLADVRRILGLAASLPGLQRVDLVTNRRCPPAVVARASRLVAHNRERFEKRILAAPGTTGDLVLRPDPTDDVSRARSLLATWVPALHGPDPPTHAVLARTNRELAPYAAAALELGLPYLAEDDGLGALDDPGVGHTEADHAHWSVGRGDASVLAALIERMSAARARLRRPDAPLILATAHGTKGLEFDVVACIGLDQGVFPSARTLVEAESPWRAMEEQRRLAYVAWTRARRRLVLVYDPGAPSPFLFEAVEPDELGRAWCP